MPFPDSRCFGLRNAPRKGAAWLVVLTCLTYAGTSLARAEYVPKVQENFQMGECAPACSLCHNDPRGGGPRNPWAEAESRGLLATANATATVFDSDFDADTFDDRTELTAGSDPRNGANTPDSVALDASQSICVKEVPTYGCVGRLARGSEPHGTGAWLACAAAIACVMWHSRQRRS